MAKQLGMDVFPVDIGVAQPIKSEKCCNLPFGAELQTLRMSPP